MQSCHESFTRRSSNVMPCFSQYLNIKGGIIKGLQYKISAVVVNNINKKKNNH